MLSFLDNDLYKFTMQQAIWRLYPDAHAVYTFINRNPERDKFDQSFVRQLRAQISQMADWRLTTDEEAYLCELPYMLTGYPRWLAGYRYDPDEVIVGLTKEGQLGVRIAGPWQRTVLWEVPLMAMISELYCSKYPVDEQVAKEQLWAKVQIMQQCQAVHSDFGTRRRRSAAWHDNVVRCLQSRLFAGTSNVHLARKYDVRAIGTMAHEWIQAHAVLCGLGHANRYALQAWRTIYPAWLDIALTDTFGTAAFLADFDSALSRQFSGVRQDSGDPFKFVDRMLAHYRTTDEDPTKKTIVFSNALKPATDVPLLQARCKDRVRCHFGIGTELTNDFGPEAPAMNMVIKLTELNGVPVVKLSDDRTKACGDADALRVARWTFFGTPLDS